MYPELVNSSQTRLVVLACETDGRWGKEAQEVIWQLAKRRTEAELPWARKRAEHIWMQRCWGILSIAAQDTYAASLSTGSDLGHAGSAAEREPARLADIATEHQCSYGSSPTPSRMGCPR